MTDLERLMSNTDKQDCWVYGNPSSTKKWYPNFWMGGKCHNTHRASWILHFGTIPVGMKVLHRCDNAKCIRPDHLFLGTSLDNTRDMLRKGRGATGLKHGSKTMPWRVARGDKSGHNKLSGNQVIEMRRLREAERLRYSELAIRFDTTVGNVHLIITRRNWKHI